MKVGSRFTFDKVRHDVDNDIHLVIDLVAPKSEWQSKRQPLCIIPVIDRSGSMSGDKLHYVKQSLLKLVDHLSSHDYMGLVSFANGARLDATPEKMTVEKKDRLRAIIGNYQAYGGTGLSAGLVEALKMANNMDLHESTLVRVILFTDGHPTHGVTSPEGLKELLGKQMGRASVSTFGYGMDACQELLQEMSVVGKGNYAFIRDPDSALSAFGKELGGLLSTYAQNITVSVKPRNGHMVTEVLTDVDVDEEVDGEVTIKVPHILSEETFNVVLSTKMAKQKSAGPRQVNAFDVSVSYQVLDSDGNLVTKTEDTKAKIQFVKEGEEQSKPTKEVDEIVARAQLVKAQIAAEEAAKKGDYAGAGNVLLNFSKDAEERGHCSIVQVSDRLQTMYNSPTTYMSTSGNRSALRCVMTRSVASSGMDIEDQQFLASAGYCVSNSVQEKFEKEFQEGVQPVEQSLTPDSAFGSNPFDWTVGAGDSDSNDKWVFGVGLGEAYSTSKYIVTSSGDQSVSSDGTQKPARKTSKKKPSSPSGKVKKSRSQRW